MHSPSLEEAALWLSQAADLNAAARFADEVPFAACFYAQQAAEKALKAVFVVRGAEFPWIHSVGRLLRELAPEYPQLRRFYDGAAILDGYYTGTRYPSPALGIAPSDSFTPANAADAVALAAPVVEECRRIYDQLARTSTEPEQEEI